MSIYKFLTVRLLICNLVIASVCALLSGWPAGVQVFVTLTATQQVGIVWSLRRQLVAAWRQKNERAG